MKHYYYNLLLLLFSTSTLFAQEQIEATLIDSTSAKTVPFATVTVNNSYGVVSNTDGKFLINLNVVATKKDTLHISCMGYETKQIAVLKITDTIIYLHPKTFELHEVTVTSENYTAKEIIEKVKERLENNYDFTYQKSTAFFRESNFAEFHKKEIKVKKSSIPEFNQQFFDSITNSMPIKADHYTEVLGTRYGSYRPEKNQKLDILKASELYDKNNEVTFESFEKRINNIIKKRVKRDSYFKIKSGLFGTKEAMDSAIFNDSEAVETSDILEEKRKQEIENKENFLNYRKQSITGLEQSSALFNDTNLNFLEKSSKYKFELLDYIFLNNKYVYKISFAPKGGADYKGMLYINPEDFAIERFDFKNVKTLKSFNLLGLSYQYKLHTGTFIYSKNRANKYVLKYAETTASSQFGIDRPLKIIEKNKNVKGRRKQNEISGRINFIISSTEKKELVVFKNESITKNEFEEFKEKANTKATYLPEYDPEFWKGYNVIEPNEAIKSFKSIE